MSFKGEAIGRSSHTNTFNRHSLYRMGYSKSDGSWRKGATEEEVEDDKVEGEDPFSPPRDCKVSSKIKLF